MTASLKDNNLKEGFRKIVTKATEKHRETATSDVICLLEDYLLNWKTDILDRPAFFNLFHAVDQLSFELAVQGYMRKTDALFIRDWLQDLASVGYESTLISPIPH